MLVIDRKLQEGFWIDDRIFVKVLGIGRRRVKLGIDAPADLLIARDELVQRSGDGAPVRSGNSVSPDQARGHSGDGVGGAKAGTSTQQERPGGRLDRSRREGRPLSSLESPEAA
ncbi:MAG: carbon storage regulator [Chloroflexi bacterium]|nr:carbon storage regulator [Chloroflexota bacterium]